MTRIIAGTAGGRRLRTPTGDQTRPTADRVREALFSAIESSLGSLSGLRFLDLYAGSGAVGLEAASRGAVRVSLVEQDRRTALLIGDNARTLGLSAAEVVNTPVATALVRPAPAPYDVVFLDPPYAVTVDQVAADLRALVAGRWVTPGALVVVERSRRGPALEWPDGYQATRSKKYGETMLWYGHAASTPAAEEQ